MIRAQLLFLSLALLPFQSLSADGGDIIWTFQGIEDIRCLTQLHDQNADGDPEIVVETYDAGADGDHLYCLSGGDSGIPEVLWSIRPESGASNGGGYSDDCLITVSDLSGDAYPDVVLGTAWGNRSVHAVNGLTGDVLWTFDTYLEFESGWIYSLDSFPDRTGDGLPEIAVAIGSENNAGYLLDGADGSMLFRFVNPYDALFMTRVISDANEDDICDVIFAAGDNDHSVYCVSGASNISGQEIWSTDTGGSNYALCVLGDIDGDGVDDIAVGNWTSSNQVKALSGRTGEQLWVFHAGSYNYIMRLVTMNDADGDAYSDIVVGSWDNALRVVSGLTGDLIWQSFAGSTNGGDFWAVDRVDDLTGDGVDEVVGASFDTQVYLFNGANGDTLWIRGTGRRHYTVRGVGDLNESGAADVVAGQQYLSGGGFAYALEGGSATPVESWPQVEGSAEYFADCGVGLRWSCDQSHPFNIYRLDEASGRQAGRMIMAESVGRGELAAFEAKELIISQEEPTWIRLNSSPISGTQGPGLLVNFDYTDVFGAASSLYRLSIIVDGEEYVVHELLATNPGLSPSHRIAEMGSFPNPFNPTLTLSFELRQDSSLELIVHDIKGRIVDRQGPRSFIAGTREWHWLAPDALSTGTYFLTLESGEEHRTVRTLLLK